MILFKRTAALLIVTILFAAATAHAEIKIYTGIGEYTMNDKTIEFAKNQAELIAERNALEQVKLYIKSNSRIVNSKLVEDEIIVIAAGILHVKDTKFEIDDDADEFIVKAFVTAEIDVDELKKLLEHEIKTRLPDSTGKTFARRGCYELEKNFSTNADGFSNRRGIIYGSRRRRNNSNVHCHRRRLSERNRIAGHFKKTRT